MFTTRRVPCPRDPPIVQSSIRFTKLVSITLTPVAGVANITPTVLATGLPSLPSGAALRINYIRVWGDSSSAGTSGDVPELVAKIAPSTGETGVNFSDVGVPGQSRPGIAWEFGLPTQSRWYTLTQTNLLATIAGGLITSDSYHLQASLEVTIS